MFNLFIKKRIYISLLIVVALICCFMQLNVDADETEVAANFQAVLLSKIVALEQTMQNSDAEMLELAIFYDVEQPDSMSAKNSFRDVFKTLDMYGKPVNVSEVTDIAELKNYHMVYLAKLNDDLLGKVVEDSKANKYVTIGSVSDNAEKGCVLSFGRIKGRSKIIINKTAADEVGANFSSQVVSIAKIIY